eukprot:Phypoly_transcript_15146.p1 GENE.Phypoly_transcript_15146~~Phypoly_transcript_15146.p1  ORF type:complete len:178 (+),score=23.50 Phypoly_transcript_15146:382-915(+)
MEMKCNKVGCGVRSSKLKKCSKCLSAFYCSRECQIADWNDGHKKACPILKEKYESGKGKLDKKKATLERTVATDYIMQNLLDFHRKALAKKLMLPNCVVVANFAIVDTEKTDIYPIEVFYEKEIYKHPFCVEGEIDPSLFRMRTSHQICTVPSFIAIVVQPSYISAFVVPAFPGLHN